MWLINCAFVGQRNFDVIEMHGTTIKISALCSLPISLIGMFIRVDSVCCVHNNEKCFVTHPLWDFLENDCHHHAKWHVTLRPSVVGSQSCPLTSSVCAMTSLYVTTVLNCHWLLVLLEKLPTFVWTLHASSWPLSCDCLAHCYTTEIRTCFSTQLWRTEGGKSYFAKSYNDALLGFCTRRIIQILH
jgi:hypothetical protein